MIRPAISLKFQCIFKSPFHTTQRKYQNLLKCAPYILGTTIRGSILGFLIQKFCTDNKINELKKIGDSESIAKFHRECEEDCIVKEIYQNLSDFHCSFGTFSNDGYMSLTRISLNRDRKVSSEGAIVNVECIKENTKFDFELILFEEMMNFKKEIKETIENAGRYFGIGKFKSVGLGKFAVTDVSSQDLTHIFEYNDQNSIDSDITSTFQSPFIFNIKSVNETILTKQICDLIDERYHEIARKKTDTRIKIKNLSIEMKPEFIHRYSLEQSKIENRLVFEVGSILKYQIENFKETNEQIEIASRFGIGEWRNCGFGRFDVTSNKRTD
jgi:hypothetical protein